MNPRKPKEATKVVFDDTFLHEELAKFEAEQQEFLAQKFSEKQLESFANRSGYRTYRIAQQCSRTQHQLLQRFVGEPAFARLWQILHRCDQSWLGTQGYSFSSRHGGFPAKLLQQVANWYQAPKLTKRENDASRRKMMAACDVLLSHLHQLSSGGSMDSFSKLNRPEPWQVEELYRLLNTKETYEARVRKFEGKVGHKLGDAEAYALQVAGFTPTFAIQSLRDTLERNPNRHGRMPTKIRASGAMKTHFIGVVDRLLTDVILHANSQAQFELQHIAELVSLITNSDCSLEDVQKARIVNRKNEVRQQEDFAKMVEKSSIGN